ncbi:MAG TPA: hypothetical protein VF692_00520, partial [Pyrinomonadaceae bacterium]
MSSEENQRILGILPVLMTKLMRAMDTETEFTLTKEEVSDLKKILKSGGLGNLVPHQLGMALDDFP